jgi:putative transcriptional regulator
MNKNNFLELIESLKEGAEILQGNLEPSRKFEYTSNEIRSLRNRLNLSQEKFANQLGISTGTLKNWEQGRRKPTGPANVLLKMVDKNPEFFNQLSGN